MRKQSNFFYGEWYDIDCLLHQYVMFIDMHRRLLQTKNKVIITYNLCLPIGDCWICLDVGDFDSVYIDNYKCQSKEPEIFWGELGPDVDYIPILYIEGTERISKCIQRIVWIVG